MLRSPLLPLLSTIALILLWAALAYSLQSRYLPTPLDVASAFETEFTSGALFFHIGATCLRVLGAFCLALLFGTALGLALGRSPKANLLFDPWLIFALNLPALVVIVFCYLWLGLTETAAIIAVALNKIPNTAVTMREGARALDPSLDEVAAIYGYTGWKKFNHFTLPQLEPFLASAIRNGLALIWKIVLVVELIGRSNGVGFQINFFFAQFDLARIMVYTLSFMVIVGLIEANIIKPWETRARFWRGDA
jgi:NitT/TauT family transport system permease protein